MAIVLLVDRQQVVLFRFKKDRPQVRVYVHLICLELRTKMRLKHLNFDGHRNG